MRGKRLEKIAARRFSSEIAARSNKEELFNTGSSLPPTLFKSNPPPFSLESLLLASFLVSSRGGEFFRGRLIKGKT